MCITNGEKIPIQLPITTVYQQLNLCILHLFIYPKQLTVLVYIKREREREREILVFLIFTLNDTYIFYLYTAFNT